MRASFQRRIELNAMTSDVFIGRLEAMAAASKTKVPADLAEQVRAMIEGTASSWDHAIDTLASRSWSDG